MLKTIDLTAFVSPEVINNISNNKWVITIPVNKEFPIGTWRTIIKAIAEKSWEDFDVIVKKYKIKF